MKNIEYMPITRMLAREYAMNIHSDIHQKALVLLINSMHPSAAALSALRIASFLPDDSELTLRQILFEANPKF